ncbi:L-cystine-binding protein TcyJ [Paenibacillus sp. Root52]|uniref:L-cystine transport system substrate-binding protein n=1 Tax=Paenibacillus amylolyticus TaxID=1451 RepID=A0AAP5LQ31_PAEAM|nr:MULTISPECIES: transporter substrate-binding domain-containing protein [Paenibacillus]KQY84129.1 L-cystine-binding protein TcyJ [Paenibacillus sp. Root52]MDR6726921.1 L-cystine transport system substrate-binding protein [Paenibacillus amylolyticus]
MKKWSLLTVTTALLVALTGCSAGEETPTAAGADGAQAPTKIIVGTGTQFPNVAFIDDNNKLTGYDVELVREIDKRLDDYEFEFQTLEFTNLLLSLETNKIDMVAHQMEKNPEREEKYLFNKEAYSHWKNKIAVLKDDNAIQSIDDLKGKKVFTTATSAQAILLENYNKEHDNALEIVYSSGVANDFISQLKSKRVAASIAADFTLPLIDPNNDLKLVGAPLSESDTLFMFRKNDPEEQKLADRVDEVLKEIKADGTLKQLSEQWLGFDATESEIK